MAKGFKHGAGGTSLNFKVVGNPQPETAKENTIWVNADKINNCYFSATQPENMVDHDIWFPIGTSSAVAFSATKKNPIMVYPISAKQWVNGALVDKTAKSYQGGKWVDWIVYIFNNQTPEDDFKVMKSSEQYGTVSFTGGTIEFGYTGSNAGDSEVAIIKKVPINTIGKSKIKVVAKVTTLAYSGVYPRFGIAGTIPSGNTYSTFDEFGCVANAAITSTSNDKETYELPIEAYQGEYYFVFASVASKGIVYDIRVV